MTFPLELSLKIVLYFLWFVEWSQLGFPFLWLTFWLLSIQQSFRFAEETKTVMITPILGTTTGNQHIANFTRQDLLFSASNSVVSCSSPIREIFWFVEEADSWRKGFWMVSVLVQSWNASFYSSSPIPVLWFLIQKCRKKEQQEIEIHRLHWILDRLYSDFTLKRIFPLQIQCANSKGRRNSTERSKQKVSIMQQRGFVPVGEKSVCSLFSCCLQHSLHFWLFAIRQRIGCDKTDGFCLSKKSEKSKQLYKVQKIAKHSDFWAARLISGKPIHCLTRILSLNFPFPTLFCVWAHWSWVVWPRSSTEPNQVSTASEFSEICELIWASNPDFQSKCTPLLPWAVRSILSESLSKSHFPGVMRRQFRIICVFFEVRVQFLRWKPCSSPLGFLQNKNSNCNRKEESGDIRRNSSETTTREPTEGVTTLSDWLNCFQRTETQQTAEFVLRKRFSDNFNSEPTQRSQKTLSLFEIAWINREIHVAGEKT